MGEKGICGVLWTLGLDLGLVVRGTIGKLGIPLRQIHGRDLELDLGLTEKWFSNSSFPHKQIKFVKSKIFRFPSILSQSLNSLISGSIYLSNYPESIAKNNLLTA